MKRPGLSIIGFDNGGDNQYGLGLEQVLNEAFTTGTNKTKELILRILDISTSNSVDLFPNNDDIILRNSRILQYKAFEALASYVLEENGIDSVTSNDTYDIPIRSHATVMAELKEVFEHHNAVSNHTPNPFPLVENRSDYVKNVKSYGNIARFLDLYLALENAYKEWDYSEWNNEYSTILPTWDEKRRLFAQYITECSSLYGDLVKSVAPGTTEDEVEPGNRPLKGYLTLGYGDLATGSDLGDFSEAKIKGSSPTPQNRTKYWMYQTENGSRFWAEGPYYFDYTLPDAFQFWHAVRANNLLGSTTDPFENSWFLNPLEWLADISTPDGLTPPIDDGNKFQHRIPHLLRWHDDYGDSNIGKKFNTVYKNIKEFRPNAEYSNNLYLLDLAVPKRPASSDKTLPSITQTYEHQFILRRTDNNGDRHYILFNKENGDATYRGEGHEQPDQLQVLYYVNEHSLLADAGFNAAPKFENDSFNRYWLHNVMYFDNQEVQYTTIDETTYLRKENRGGLPSPYTSAIYTYPRKVSAHDNLTYSAAETFGNNDITFLRGRINLSVNNRSGAYDRSLYFVEGNGNPYLIDMNVISNVSHPNNVRMKYHSGFDNYTNPNSNNSGWGCWNQNLPNEYCVSIVSNDNHTLTKGTENILEYENKTGGNKIPYSVDYLKAHPNNGDHTFSTISFIRYGEKIQNDIEVINSANNVQIAYINSGNMIDVVAYNPTTNPIIFTIENNGTPLIDLEILSERGGFVRLKKDNFSWSIDSGYNHNNSFLESKNYYVFDSSSNGPFPNFAPGSEIYIEDNVILTFSGMVNLDGDSEIILGQNSKIEITNNGALNIDGTVNGSSGSSIVSSGDLTIDSGTTLNDVEVVIENGGELVAYGIILDGEGLVFNSGSDGQITSSTIKNANRGIELNGSTTPLIEGNTIEDNSTGIWVNSGVGSGAEILDNNILYNNSHGIASYYSSPTIEDNFIYSNFSYAFLGVGSTASFNGNQFNGADYGLYLFNGSAVQNATGNYMIDIHHSAIHVESPVTVVAQYNDIIPVSGTDYLVRAKYDATVIASYNFWVNSTSNFFYATDGAQITYTPQSPSPHTPYYTPPKMAQKAAGQSNDTPKAQSCEESYQQVSEWLSGHPGERTQRALLTAKAGCWRASGKPGFVEYLNKEVRPGLSKNSRLYATTLEMENLFLMDQGKYEEAIANYETLRKNFANDPLLHQHALFGLGYIHSLVKKDTRSGGII